MITIDKELLKNYRFSDNAIAWALEARAFMDAVKRLLSTPPKPAHTKFISSAEANLNYMNLKVVAYLFSVAIELFLKGIYSANKTQEDQEKTESFGHNVIKLNQKLISKEIFKIDELNTETLELVKIILQWSGRYYKPLPNEIDKIVESRFEGVPGRPTMVKSKFSINLETVAKLQHTAQQLADIATINPAAIEHLLFLPF